MILHTKSLGVVVNQARIDRVVTTMAYRNETNEKCPYCNQGVLLTTVSNPNTSHPFSGVTVQTSKDQITISTSKCPLCQRLIIALDIQKLDDVQIQTGMSDPQHILVWPINSGRPPVPPEVPKHHAKDYNEAASVLGFSPKSSAALSRRCLQTMLREIGKTTKKDLADQIDEVLPKLPEYLGSQLHALRQIGNFAAHTQKSTTTGEIIDIEPGEAEWTLDILDNLFDFYYVKPSQEQKRKDELNKKLQAAGKPPVK